MSRYELPTHRPRERSHQRIDDGFVLIDGWQRRYDPTPERRTLVLSRWWALRLRGEAEARLAVRRALEQERQGRNKKR